MVKNMMMPILTRKPTIMTTTKRAFWIILVLLCGSCGMLSQCSDLPSLYDDLVSAVVTIDGRGSGVFVTEDLVLTANHVVGNEENFTIVLWNTIRVYGKTFIRDVDSDLALVKIDAGAVKFLEIRRLSFDAYPKIGDRVFVIGSPFMFANTMSTGIVSRLSTRLDNSPWICELFLVDYKTAPGYSGSPVFDANGRVVGIHVGSMGNFGLMIPSYSVNCFLKANGL